MSLQRTVLKCLATPHTHGLITKLLVREKGSRVAGLGHQECSPTRSAFHTCHATPRDWVGSHRCRRYTQRHSSRRPRGGNELGARHLCDLRASVRPDETIVPGIARHQRRQRPEASIDHCRQRCDTARVRPEVSEYVVRRALSQRGVTYSWVGGTAAGPWRGDVIYCGPNTSHLCDPRA